MSEDNQKISRSAIQAPAEKYPDLKVQFGILEEQLNEHINLSRKLFTVAGGNIYVTDLVVISFLNRSLSLVSGIIDLVNRWNFIAAAPLVRLQIDNLLRLVYLAQAVNRIEICKQILDGKSFHKLKDAENKYLNDARLRDYARSLYPWIDNVYKETSKLIHFSEKHCFLPVSSVVHETRTITHFIGTGCPHWPETEIKIFLETVEHITDALLKVVYGWVATKERLR